jgi:flagellar biogenesis protein FliO
MKTPITTLLCAAALLPSLAYAEAATRALPDAPAGHGAALLRMILSLTIVCAIAYAALHYLAKRVSSPTGRGADSLRVLARLPIEPRRSIFIVRVGARTLVVGSSEAGLETLSELTPAEAAPFLHDESHPA